MSRDMLHVPIRPPYMFLEGDQYISTIEQFGSCNSTEQSNQTHWPVTDIQRL